MGVWGGGGAISGGHVGGALMCVLICGGHGGGAKVVLLDDSTKSDYLEKMVNVHLCFVSLHCIYIAPSLFQLFIRGSTVQIVCVGQ